MNIKVKKANEELFEKLRADPQLRDEVSLFIREVEAELSTCKQCLHRSVVHSDEDGACYCCSCPQYT